MTDSLLYSSNTATVPDLQSFSYISSAEAKKKKKSAILFQIDRSSPVKSPDDGRRDRATPGRSIYPRRPALAESLVQIAGMLSFISTSRNKILVSLANFWRMMVDAT